MKRFIYALAFVGMLVGGAADASTRERTPIGEEHDMSRSFERKLAEVRQRWDVVPWVVVLSQDIDGNAPAGEPIALTHKEPYAFLVQEITYAGYHEATAPGPLLALSPFRFDLEWKTGAGDARQKQLIPQAFGTRGLLGDPATSWHGAGAGLFLEEDHELVFNGSTLEACDDGGGRVDIVLRGYRLYPAGSVAPIQRTWLELERANAELQDHPVGVRVEVPASVAESARTEYRFKEDFVATRLAITTADNGGDETSGGYGAYASGLEVFIEAGDARPLMNDFVNRLALVGSSPRTVWHWPVPITVKKNTRWFFKARHRKAPAVVSNVDFILHGYDLKTGVPQVVRPGKG